LYKDNKRTLSYYISLSVVYLQLPAAGIDNILSMDAGVMLKSLGITTSLI